MLVTLCKCTSVTDRTNTQHTTCSLNSIDGRKASLLYLNAHHAETDVIILQELRESRGGRPGLSVLTSLLVSVDVKIY